MQIHHMVEGLNHAGFVVAVVLEKSLRIKEEHDIYGMMLLQLAALICLIELVWMVTRPRHTATGVSVGLISEFELDASGGDLDIGAIKDSGLGDTT